MNIDLTLTTPANAKGPVPVIMELGFSKEFMAMLIKRFPQFAPENQKGPTWQQQVLAKGWGYAEYVPTSVQDDNGAGLTKGIIGLVNKGQPRKLDDWGTLKAWGWGASRCLDYFETDKAVDAKQVGIEGHSRYGKATLVTMAYDPRFAVAYVSSSGEGGAKLYRHIFGEQVGNVAATNEYHWMAGNFLKYAGPLTPGDLPVDNHELIALCAPRPVFISGGATDGDDRWIDPKGMFLAAVAAGPVYRLLGKKDLGTSGISAHGDGADRWRHRVAPALGRAHAGPQLAHVSHLRRPLSAWAGSGCIRRSSCRFTSPRRRIASGCWLFSASRTRTCAGRRPRDAKAPNATNYDESKANVYPNLPDPLLLKNGQRVTSPEVWFDQRRPEIVADYEHEILGRAPANLPGRHVAGRQQHARKIRRRGRGHEAAFGPRRQLHRSANLRQHRPRPHHSRQSLRPRSRHHGTCL